MQPQPIPVASTSRLAAISASPATLRPASFGARFFAGSPLGPLARPDFGFAPRSLEEFVDPMLRGDVTMLQEDMCRNYTCCGLALLDLHALVEHFEEAHVVVLDAPSSPDDSAGIDLDDMDMDEPAPLSAFDTTSVLTHRSSHAAPAYSPYAPRRAPLAGGSACVQPALLFGSAPASPLVSPAPSRSASPAPLSAAGGDGVRPKPFRCPQPGCNKSYKQANGLKYHVTHGACNFAPRAPSDDAPKPFVCQAGCPKRFKNMSGLRYHYAHTAEHGRLGLAMLQAGAPAV